jgi:hypothetical protein
MALAGAMIVFSGLIILSLAIAQLHKLLNLLEKKDVRAGVLPEPDDAIPAEIVKPGGPLTDLAALAETYRPLTAELDETFALADLYEQALRNDLPHPHLSIKTLREGRFLVAQGDGLFAWHPAENV